MSQEREGGKTDMRGRSGVAVRLKQLLRRLSLPLPSAAGGTALEPPLWLVDR
jgi:hypothetical protein